MIEFGGERIVTAGEHGVQLPLVLVDAQRPLAGLWRGVRQTDTEQTN